MDSLLRALNLTPAEEKRLTDELGDWETKGMALVFLLVLIRIIYMNYSHDAPYQLT